MNINHISSNAYYINASNNIGVLVNSQGEALLIDTGIDDSIARKIRRMLEEAGWVLKGIFLTHHHADHTGGAPFLVRATGASIYASSIEKGFIEYSLAEPLYLFSGAAPPHTLRNKFFQAPGVKVNKTVDPGEVLQSWGCTAVSLTGHSMGQMGIMTEDKVLYSADAVIGPDFLIKHGVPLNADIGETLTTYHTIDQLAPVCLVPAHGEVTNEAKELTAANRMRVLEIIDLIQKAVHQQARWEDILASVASRVGMRINNLGEYSLANLSTMAYLSYLLEQGYIHTEYKDGRQFIYPKEQ